MCRLYRDCRAQAITEFVLIIPIVLLMFLAAIQTMVVARCAQMCNYAAFAAARSFATGHAKFERDGAADPYAEARKRAHLVACMAVAPVSKATRPPTTGFSEAPDGIFNLELTPSGALAGTSVPNHLRQQILEGFVVALTMRVHDFSVEPAPAALETSSSKEEVTVSFRYMVPVTLPGLMEIWNWLEDFRPDYDLTEDLEIMVPRPGRAPFIASYVGDVGNIVSNWQPYAGAGALAGPYRDYYRNGGESPPAIAIQARCTVGYEPLIGDIDP
jgi:hypothetical protein